MDFYIYSLIALGFFALTSYCLYLKLKMSVLEQLIGAHEQMIEDISTRIIRIESDK